MSRPAYSRQVLEETPARVLQFLGGVGTSSLIRGALAKVDYGEKDHQEGWSLLHRASGYQAPATEPAIDRAAADAIAELDAWDEPHFRLARAALERRYPEQAEFLFSGLEPAAGAAAILSVKTFLDRLDALEGKAKGRDPGDKARKQADAAAVALLAGRRISGEERARLRKLIATAEKGVKPDTSLDQLAATGEKQAEARLQALVDLRAWFDEWAETARVVIKRRDQLIRLGLARRRSGEDGPAPTPTPEPEPEPTA